jgi:hypothetical protein
MNCGFHVKRRLVIHPKMTQPLAEARGCQRLTLIVINEGDGARTRNHRIDRPIKTVFFASKMRIRGHTYTSKSVEKQGNLCRDTGLLMDPATYGAALLNPATPAKKEPSASEQA